MTAVLPGFFLGFSLILAIGAQNAFVLRQGLVGEHVFAVCLACALSDAVLVAGGVLGLSGLVDVFPALVPLLRYAGAAFLLLCGLRAARAAFGEEDSLEVVAKGGGSLRRTLSVCLALTWLNPHVYLDTVLLIGSVSTQYADRMAFAAGAIMASFIFFFALGYGAALLRPIFARPASWRILEGLIALAMWSIAAKLLLG